MSKTEYHLKQLRNNRVVITFLLSLCFVSTPHCSITAAEAQVQKDFVGLKST